MTTSRIFAAQNALLAVATAALAATTVEIYDGPQPTLPTNPRFLIVGCDNPLADGMMQAVTNGQQDWLELGSLNPSRQESFSLLNTYVTWSGDNDFPTLRSNASTDIGLIETALRPNFGASSPDGMLGTNTTSGPLAPTGWCNLSIRDVQVVSDDLGTAMHVVFGVDCWTRI